MMKSGIPDAASGLKRPLISGTLTSQGTGHSALPEKLEICDDSLWLNPPCQEKSHIEQPYWPEYPYRATPK